MAAGEITVRPAKCDSTEQGGGHRRTNFAIEAHPPDGLADTLCDKGNYPSIEPKHGDVHMIVWPERARHVGQMPLNRCRTRSGVTDIPLALHPHHNLTACECCVQYFDQIIEPSFKTGNTMFFRERKLADYKQQEEEEAKQAESKSAADLANGHSTGSKQPAAPRPDISSLLAKWQPPFGEPPIPMEEDEESPGNINPAPVEPDLSIPQATAAPSRKETGQMRKVG